MYSRESTIGMCIYVYVGMVDECVCDCMYFVWEPQIQLCEYK